MPPAAPEGAGDGPAVPLLVRLAPLVLLAWRAAVLMCDALLAWLPKLAQHTCTHMQQDKNPLRHISAPVQRILAGCGCILNP